MIEKEFQDFWKQIGIPCYSSNNVPLKDRNGKDIKMPYLTYDYAVTEFATSAFIQVVLWTRSVASIAELSELSDRIVKLIPAYAGAGITLPDGRGVIRIYRGTPFMQSYPQDDKDVKANYFVLEVRTYIM